MDDARPRNDAHARRQAPDAAGEIEGRSWRRTVSAAGILTQIAVGALILPSGLIMPGWAVASLTAVWLIGVWASIRWRRHPVRVLAVPVGTVALWFLVGWVGDVWLGWTA